MIIPKSHDHIVKESRDLVKNLRRNFPNPEDFDQQVKKVIKDMLIEYDYDRASIDFTLRAIFG